MRGLSGYRVATTPIGDAATDLRCALRRRLACIRADLANPHSGGSRRGLEPVFCSCSGSPRWSAETVGHALQELARNSGTRVHNGPRTTEVRDRGPRYIRRSAAIGQGRSRPVTSQVAGPPSHAGVSPGMFRRGLAGAVAEAGSSPVNPASSSPCSSTRSPERRGPVRRPAVRPMEAGRARAPQGAGFRHPAGSGLA